MLSIRILLLAAVIAGCGDSAVERAWCHSHGGELQELGRWYGVDYSALDREAWDHVPPAGDQATREQAYRAYLETNPTWLDLCREANVRRRGLDDWTAPPFPTRSPPGGGEP